MSTILDSDLMEDIRQAVWLAELVIRHRMECEALEHGADMAREIFPRNFEALERLAKVNKRLPSAG